MVFLILAKLFGWGPCFTKKIKGIEISAQDGKSFDFENFKKDGYTFVMVKSGTGKDKVSSFDEKLISNLKEVKIGTYWEIPASDQDTALEQVQSAVNSLGYYKDKLQSEYKIYLQISEKTLLKNETITNNICKNLKDHNFVCGIKLKYEEYKEYYQKKVDNLNNIQYYWIIDYNKEFDEDKEKKVELWKMDSDSKYKSYDIIQARKNK